MENNAIIEGSNGKIIVDDPGCQEEMVDHIIRLLE